jgi:hypothetical protein
MDEPAWNIHAFARTKLELVDRIGLGRLFDPNPEPARPQVEGSVFSRWKCREQRLPLFISRILPQYKSPLTIQTSRPQPFGTIVIGLRARFIAADPR